MQDGGQEPVGQGEDGGRCPGRLPGAGGRGACPGAAATGPGKPPRAPAAGPCLAWPTGSWPPSLPLPPESQVAIAALLGIRPKTVSKRLRDIRQLLDQAGAAQPQRLEDLEELYDLARSSGIDPFGQDRVSVLFSGKPLAALAYV